MKSPNADELADIIILVLDLGYLLDIDLEQAVIDKMIINRKRSWIRDPKTGIARHV
jgi:NTP pyrophosphatase (non-canonical NTP hydrolase)